MDKRGQAAMKSNVTKKKIVTYSLSLILAILLFSLIYDFFGFGHKDKGLQVSQTQTQSHENKRARIVANGDILIHDLLYFSAEKSDGSYDFTPYFEYVKDFISDADLAIGDFEGTISQDYPLAGYPLFNAPIEISRAIKSSGYDVVDLAHNHILDSGLEGALNTQKTFSDLGIDSIGIYKTDRQKEKILIKHVNGIKIAILGYSYGYNGMDANLSKKQYEQHLSDFDTKKMETEIKEAEKQADVTVVMPQTGVEYQLTPTKEQKNLYRSMVNWGADVVLGGHPHVVEPAEVIKKGKDKKLIIYSMGNFISNQRLETLDDIWTERGLLMDVTFEKSGSKTIIKTVTAHPTMVIAKSKGIVGKDGFELYNYRTLILKDFIKGGKYRNKIDSETQNRVDRADKEMNDHVNLEW